MIKTSSHVFHCVGFLVMPADRTPGTHPQHTGLIDPGPPAGHSHHGGGCTSHCVRLPQPHIRSQPLPHRGLYNDTMQSLLCVEIFILLG